MWDEVWATLVSEFSDLPDAAQFTRIVLRLVLAGALGALLGFEREQQGKAAGVRTHMLVAMGSAMFVMIPQNAGLEQAEMSRVIQGIIAGVGFLCAGTILKGDSEEQVTGLTTAAGLWLTAAIGVAAGLGRDSTAVLCALLAWGVLALAPLLTGLMGSKKEQASTDVAPKGGKAATHTGVDGREVRPAED